MPTDKTHGGHKIVKSYFMTRKQLTAPAMKSKLLKRVLMLSFLCHTKYSDLPWTKQANHQQSQQEGNLKLKIKLQELKIS